MNRFIFVLSISEDYFIDSCWKYYSKERKRVIIYQWYYRHINRAL